MPLLEAAQTHLIPASELGIGEAAAIRNEIVRHLVTDVAQKLKKTPKDLVVRDIRAKDDIALYSAGSAASVEDWACVTGTTANAYETLATGTMGNNRWVAFYGVRISGFCAVTAVKFNIGGGDRAIWQLQALSEEDAYVGLCPAGIVIPENAPYDISRFVRQTSGPAFILLKGIVVEPRGLVISP